MDGAQPFGGTTTKKRDPGDERLFSAPPGSCYFLFSLAFADNAIVGMGSKPINHHIEYAEYQKCADVGAYRQPLIGQAEHGQKLPHQGERKGQMHPRHQKRNEEHRENLGIDALFDVLPMEKYRLHYADREFTFKIKAK